MKPITKVLIANRGEIAVRLIRAARALSLRTVAVFSTPDRYAPHTVLADEAVHIGPAAAASSYLNADALLAAARTTSADAVAPGYGFFSENADFADAVTAAGLTWVGPPAAAVRAMGDKVQSKAIATAAGVNVIPGYVGVVDGVAAAVDVAESIGYPVMVKASAGGGGKGMRVAWDRRDVEEAYGVCEAEAVASVGDGRLLVEKFVEHPRHVEVQVLADGHGGVIHLGERECSLQRRNQKVIEEAPCSIVDSGMRAEMGAQAVALARAVDYTSVGTVECLVSGVDRSFFFLEMNTRLQVEHLVTGAVVGLDLPMEMLRIAGGERLSLTQDDVRMSGVALEARVYAEDPRRQFVPATGVIGSYQEPRLPAVGKATRKAATPPADVITADRSGVSADGDSGLWPPPHLSALGFDNAGVLVDSGVTDGSLVGVHYDPLLAKVVVHAPTRAAAMAKLGDALDAYVIGGVTTNSPFLRALTRHPKVLAGDMTTTLIGEEYPNGFPGTPLSGAEVSAAVAVAAARYFGSHPASMSVAVRVEADGPPGEGATAGPREVVLRRVGGDGGGATPGVLQPASFSDNASVAMTSDLTSGASGAFITVGPVGERSLGTGAVSLVTTTVNGEAVTLQRLGARPYEDVGAVSLSLGGGTLSLRVRCPSAVDLEEVCARGAERAAAALGGGARGRVLPAPMPGVVLSVAVAVGDEVAEGDEVLVLEAMKMMNGLKAPFAGRIKVRDHQSWGANGCPGRFWVVGEVMLRALRGLMVHTVAPPPLRPQKPLLLHIWAAGQAGGRAALPYSSTGAPLLVSPCAVALH